MRFPRARTVAYFVFFAVLIVAAAAASREQFGKLYASLTAPPPASKGPAVVMPGPNSAAAPTASKLPTVVKLGSGPAGASDGSKPPAVVTPGSNPRGAPGASKLPTVIRPGINAPAGSSSANLIEIVDGDTFRVDGTAYLLVGINAPESGARAKCAAERELAVRTARRLREIAAGGNLLLEHLSCACPAGTEGTQSCNGGRLCGALWSANRNVGQMLINEGLAKKYDCSAGRCPPKQKWC